MPDGAVEVGEAAVVDDEAVELADVAGAAAELDEAAEPEADEEIGSPTASHSPCENCSAVVRSLPEQALSMQEVEVEMNCWLAQRQVSSVALQPK